MLYSFELEGHRQHKGKLYCIGCWETWSLKCATDRRDATGDAESQQSFCGWYDNDWRTRWTAPEMQEECDDYPVPDSSEQDFAYCCVLYGDSRVHAMMALVQAHRLFLLKRRYPLVILHCNDVPSPIIRGLKQFGCKTGQVSYIWGHDALLMYPKGRHRNVFTKLHALGLEGFSKVLLIDADILPLSSLDVLFEHNPPAGKMLRLCVPA